MTAESRVRVRPSNESFESDGHYRFTTLIRASVSFAPTVARSLPLPSQAFGEENIPDRAPIAVDDPELATEAIFIPGGRLEQERTGIQNVEQTLFRRNTSLAFALASCWAELRRVDVGDPDLFTSKPEGIAIHHAGDPVVSLRT
jgi:hypothetical protein